MRSVSPSHLYTFRMSPFQFMDHFYRRRCSDGYAFRSWSATCEDCSGDSASYTLVIAPVTLFLLTMIFILLALKVAKNVDNAHNVLSLIKFIVWPPSMSAPQHSTTVVLQECLRDFRIQFFARMKVDVFFQSCKATAISFRICLLFLGSYNILSNCFSDAIRVQYFPPSGFHVSVGLCWLVGFPFF